MDKKKRFNTDSKDLGEVFICNECGPFTRVMCELWELNTDKPFAIEFINQKDGEIKTAYAIKLYEPKEPCRIIRYYKCGHCDCFLGEPETFPKDILDKAEHALSELPFSFSKAKKKRKN